MPDWLNRKKTAERATTKLVDRTEAASNWPAVVRETAADGGMPKIAPACGARQRLSIPLMPFGTPTFVVLLLVANFVNLRPLLPHATAISATAQAIAPAGKVHLSADGQRVDQLWHSDPEAALAIIANDEKTVKKIAGTHSNRYAYVECWRVMATGQLPGADNRLRLMAAERKALAALNPADKVVPDYLPDVLSSAATLYQNDQSLNMYEAAISLYRRGYVTRCFENGTLSNLLQDASVAAERLRQPEKALKYMTEAYEMTKNAGNTDYNQFRRQSIDRLTKIVQEGKYSG